MSRERRTTDFQVGLTVLLVTVMLVASVIWIRQTDLRGDKRKLVARTRDVGGVALGNPVVVRGVRAGRVESIALGESGWVVLTLGLERGVTLPPNPVVLLAASSLFGEWQATVTDVTALPADRELRSLIAEARTESDTLAGAVLPDIAQLTAVAGRIAGDVAKVAERVQVAFDDKAAIEMRQSIRSFASLSAELARMVELQSRNLDRMSSDVSQGVKSIARAASTIDRVAGRVDSSTADGELRQIVTNSRQAAQQLLDATTRLKTVSDDVGRTQQRLHGAIERADSMFAKVNGGRGSLGLMVNDPHLYQSTDSLIAELRSLVADVKKNPKRYMNVRVF